MLKILQARFQQYMNRELPNVQAGFRKGRGEAHLVLEELCGLLRGGSEEWRLCPTDTSIMNIFDWEINFDALFKFSHITPLTQQHLKKVYACFALCMLVVAAGIYVHVVTYFIQAGLLSALGSLG